MFTPALRDQPQDVLDCSATPGKTGIWVVVSPVLGPQNTRCRIIPGTQKGTIILTTTHILVGLSGNIIGAQKPRQVNKYAAEQPSLSFYLHLLVDQRTHPGTRPSEGEAKFIGLLPMIRAI